MQSVAKPKAAFTLIELSIVLVIIGLLIAGVLVGKDLIRQAELRSVITDVERYNTAIRTFQVKYNALPGDMANAEDIWGSDAACPATPYTTTPHTTTCNGNGNKAVGEHTWGADTFRESFRAVQHLANAGLIAGQYSGTSTGDTSDAVLGVNVMESRITGAGYFPLKVYDDAAGAAPAIYYPGYYGHTYWFGKPRAGTIIIDAAISGPDAMSIDLKIDDGMAGAGKVLTLVQGNGWVPNCATTNSATTARYSSTNTIECSLLFRQQF